MEFWDLTITRMIVHRDGVVSCIDDTHINAYNGRQKYYKHSTWVIVVYKPDFQLIVKAFLRWKSFLVIPNTRFGY